MLDQFSRTELIIGAESINKLKNSRVAVFGLGGVGGYIVEALARTGLGSLDIIDKDKVCITNINRQIYALHSTVDQYKVDIAEQRIFDICPDIKVTKHKCFYLPETSSDFDFTKYDYIVDAIDTVKGKLELIKQADVANTPIISSMGAGNKLNPTELKVSDIYSTKICPLAKVMRSELRKMGIKSLKVVYSEEEPIKPTQEILDNYIQNSDVNQLNIDGNIKLRRALPGSISFVPSVAGLIIASEVIKDLIK